MAKAQPARRERRTCPACGKVGYYAAGGPAACKQCGAPLPAPGWEPVQEAAPAPPAAVPAQSVPPQARQEPALGFAIAALVCGLASLAAVWVFPVTLLLAAAAIALGAVAVSRHGGDTGVQLMGIVGIVTGSLSLLLAFLVMPFLYADSGSSSSYTYNGGSNSQTTVDGGSGSGGGGSGSGGGGSGSGGDGGGGRPAETPAPGGGSGGDGGGGAGGGGGGGGGGGSSGVGAPTVAGPLVAFALLATAAAWRRRR